mmetsp:Transcript_31636/g.51064  ORF Transcript_31636/g.51064 Transcript_31636/m.51064 type:complete len:462 (+) Transcript_31636:166-1551(+)|eukprot:CAMPEP_0184655500 /NCGR_PEP_ID=MMETSP0308-20130426/13100_1 /TAXON_ID=38269 /ORGANISM="Gloeochaete witrockiana, Strain SAG 46.84" /LENGTH=461 /DNA_ID=CAMNT_0027091993 /DNA_START=81 /DNA_END=1466 /DNA_ORIENTATION=+
MDSKPNSVAWCELSPTGFMELNSQKHVQVPEMDEQIFFGDGIEYFDPSQTKSDELSPKLEQPSPKTVQSSTSTSLGVARLWESVLETLDRALGDLQKIRSERDRLHDKLKTETEAKADLHDALKELAIVRNKEEKEWTQKVDMVRQIRKEVESQGRERDSLQERVRKERKLKEMSLRQLLNARQRLEAEREASKQKKEEMEKLEKQLAEATRSKQMTQSQLDEESKERERATQEYRDIALQLMEEKNVMAQNITKLKLMLRQSAELQQDRAVLSVKSKREHRMAEDLKSAIQSARNSLHKDRQDFMKTVEHLSDRMIGLVEARMHAAQTTPTETPRSVPAALSLSENAEVTSGPEGADSIPSPATSANAAMSTPTAKSEFARVRSMTPLPKAVVTSPRAPARLLVSTSTKSSLYRSTDTPQASKTLGKVSSRLPSRAVPVIQQRKEPAASEAPLMTVSDQL